MSMFHQCRRSVGSVTCTRDRSSQAPPSSPGPASRPLPTGNSCVYAIAACGDWGGRERSDRARIEGDGLGEAQPAGSCACMRAPAGPCQVIVLFICAAVSADAQRLGSILCEPAADAWASTKQRSQIAPLRTADAMLERLKRRR